MHPSKGFDAKRRYRAGALIDLSDGRRLPQAPTPAITYPRAGLAQLVEHLICNQGVGGSSPSAGTNEINSLYSIQ